MKNIDQIREEYQNILLENINNTNEIIRLEKESPEVQDYIRRIERKKQLESEQEAKENAYRLALMKDCRHIFMYCRWDEETKDIYHCVKCGYNNGSIGYQNDAIQKEMIHMWNYGRFKIKEKSLFLERETSFYPLYLSYYLDEIYKKNPTITDEELRDLLDKIYWNIKEKHQRKKKEITMEEFKIALEEEYQNRMIPKKSKNA